MSRMGISLVEFHLHVFSRERLAKGSCCVRLPLGPSCLSRRRCGCVAGALPVLLRVRCGCVAGALRSHRKPGFS